MKSLKLTVAGMMVLAHASACGTDSKVHKPSTPASTQNNDEDAVPDSDNAKPLSVVAANKSYYDGLVSQTFRMIDSTAGDSGMVVFVNFAGRALQQGFGTAGQTGLICQQKAAMQPSTIDPADQDAAVASLRDALTQAGIPAVPARRGGPS